MAFEQLSRRNRAIGIAGATVANALLVLGLLSLSTGSVPVRRAPGLVSFDLNRPPPPPSPQRRRPDKAAAPPSRGAIRAPSPPVPPQPLAQPTSAQPAADTGTESASGAGAASGSGAGAGGTGSGNGGAAVTPPVHIAGGFTESDFRRARLSAPAQVVVAIRVRSDGRADRCRIARSSGYARIDQATCAVIKQRFRFRPALTAGGRPVDSEVQWFANWQPS